MNELASIVATLAAMAAADAMAALRPTNRSVVEAFYAELLNDASSPHVGARAERILAADWQSIGDNSGRNKTRAAFVAQVQGFGKLVPDLNWSVQEILQQGNRYIVRSRVTGTPSGAFLGAPASGKRFDIMTIDIHTVEDGTIVCSYHVEDWAGAIRQLAG